MLLQVLPHERRTGCVRDAVHGVRLRRDRNECGANSRIALDAPYDIVLVFIPSLGAFITPDLLGGAKSIMVGNLIQNQFAQLNQPFGSALSLLLTLAVLLLLAIAFRAGLKASELA